MPLMQDELENIRAECFAEDVPITETMSEWTEEAARAFFESGGQDTPEISSLSLRGGADVGGPRTTLNDGRLMPLVGLGTWKSKPGEVKAAVKAAVKAGYRHIDCAAIYRNEHEVGEALSELFAEGIVTRKELWITSKLWNDFHKAADVPQACDKSLKDLQIEYLDLYLIHWPVATNCTGEKLSPSTEETWGAMEALKAAGKAKSIGVSNWSARKLRNMKAHAKVFPAVNQVELHPLNRQDALLAACAELGTHVTAYSPLGSPDSAAQIKHDGATVMENAVVQRVAAEVGKSAAQVLIRWAVQRGTSVLPKSVTPSRIESNFDVIGAWALSDSQMAELSAIEPQKRMLHGQFWCSPKGPYKTIADLWDE
jgi:alcohol dehydrogenase (NADP+)